MLVSSIGSAQTFDFSCGPDVNGITTHDGFEVSDDFDNVYENPSYPSITLDYITHGNPKVPGIQIQISTVITQTFLTGTSQEVYDLSVAWVLENRTPGDENGIVTHDGFELHETITNYYYNDEYEVNVSIFDFSAGWQGRVAMGSNVLERFSNNTTAQEAYDLAVAWVLENRSPIPTETATSTINVPEELRDKFNAVAFFIAPNFTPIEKTDGTRLFFEGEEIPSEATHHQISYKTPNGQFEFAIAPGYNPAIPLPDGDINITADIFPNVINIPEALNPWIQRITFQDTQDNFIKHTRVSGGNETTIYDDGDLIPEGADTYRIRIRRTLGTNNGSYDTEQISVPSSGDLNIELPTLTIQTGLSVSFLGVTFLIQGLHVNGTDYTNGSPLPSGSYNSTRVWFYNQHGERSTFSLDSHNILDGESVSLTTESSPNYIIALASVLEAGGDISGMTYNLAGKTYTISDEGGAGHTYRFQSANDPVVFFVGSNSLSVADGRIVFGASSIWDGGHVINTTGTEELERALPLVTAGVKIFYPNGRSNVTDAFFAVESDLFVTDAANMNKNIIDLTPVNGITVAPGDENAITSGSDFGALVTESRYYAYVLTNNKIGFGLVTRSGASLIITDTDNNLNIGSARGGTLFWEINGPRRINDVGSFRYIKVVNQRHSSWDDVEGYYRIHPAINGGFTDRTSETYLAAATSGDLTGGTTIDGDTIDDQTVVGDVFVIRDNSISRQGFTVGSVRSKRTGGTVYGIIFSFGAPNLGTSLNFNVGHAQKLTNTPVLQ